MDANVCDKDHNPTNCYLTVTTRIAVDRAADKTRDKKTERRGGKRIAAVVLAQATTTLMRPQEHSAIQAGFLYKSQSARPITLEPIEPPPGHIDKVLSQTSMPVCNMIPKTGACWLQP